MAHRSHEWTGTVAQLRVAFADKRYFTVHDAVPLPYGDEGAANHMRLCARHDQQGLEIFVYGKSGGPFPARQHIEASKAVARKHLLAPDQTVFVQQSEQAIAGGAFHNDVVAVANEHVLFAHELAFERPQEVYAEILAKMPQAEIIVVPQERVSISDAVSSYLFNAQLVTLPNNEGMALILPMEAQENAAVWNWLLEMITGNGPIRKLIPVNVRESMANGGGPACLRLRVVADPTTVDPRFIADEAKLDLIAAVVVEHWPAKIKPDDLRDVELVAKVQIARAALLDSCGLSELT
jgi:succinylarginine dihydrolase